jgi:hypothetical protein
MQDTQLTLRFVPIKNARKFWNLKVASLFVIYALATATNLQFRRDIPTKAGSNSPHDDLLGVRVASNILEGNWLGNWDNLILGKPPGYSFYLALAHFFPFQLVVFNQIVFCLLAFVFSVIIKKSFLQEINYKDTISLILYVALIFNPFIFGTEMSRVYRTSAHAMFIFSYSIILFYFMSAILEYNSRKDTIRTLRKKIFTTSVILGLNYAVLILLRSESYWILIASVPSILFVFRKKYSENSNSKAKKEIIGSAVLLISITFVSYLIPISLIGQINNTAYGSSLIENYYSGGFAKAMKAWQKVENGKDPRPYVMVSRGQLQAVYKISPTAALLEPSLDLNPGQGWQIHPCNAPIKLCDNSGPWFPWQVRDAAISTGKVLNEVDFQNFFLEISRDIEFACQNGALMCGPEGLGVGAKPITELPVDQIIKFAYENFLSSIPKNSAPVGLIATPDQYGASGEVVNEYHDVVKYKAAKMNSTNVPTVSPQLKTLESFYFPLQTAAFYISMIGYLLAWKHKKRYLIYAMLGFGVFAILLASTGVALAQVSFGWRVEGPYLLPIQPILQFLTCVGIYALITLDKTTLNLFRRNK